jgi:hypothetical protein
VLLLGINVRLTQDFNGPMALESINCWIFAVDAISDLRLGGDVDVLPLLE